MSYSLARLREAFRDNGVTRAYYKWLATNDNSKNQIYLGSDYGAINILPIGAITSEATGKAGRPVLKAPLPLSWLTHDGRTSPAPNTQVILYGQYPEIRMSGFLKGSVAAPSDLLASRAEGRVLFLGVTSSGEVIGHAVGTTDPISRELPPRDPADQLVLQEFPLLGAGPLDDSRTQLLEALGRLHRAGWIDSKRLNSAGLAVPCISAHCGGYTLEAELGVRPNGISKPDFLGWELKQHSVKSFEKPGGPITLITPEPDGGLYKIKGAESFIRTYGYPDRRGRTDRINFGGVHRAGHQDPGTRLTLQLRGFDTKTARITDVNGGICLTDEHGADAAVWGFAKLIGQWKRKHAKAAFVKSQRRENPVRQYRYGGTVELGQDSDLAMFLTAIQSGEVYYDPALKIEAASSARPRIKRRSQFRIKASRVGTLYRVFSPANVG